MGVPHGHLNRPETTLPNQGADLRRGIIGHQEIHPTFSQHCEEPTVLHAVMGIEPLAGPLAASGIGRVDKYRGMSSAGGKQKGIEKTQAIGLAKAYAVGMARNLLETADKSIGVPP